MSRDPARQRTQARAEELVRTAGLPPPLAWQVASGKTDLNTVLRKLAVKDKVEALVQRHGFVRALAMQIALGQADLEHALRMQRQAAHLEANKTRSALDGAHAAGTPIALALHGLATARGHVREVRPFEMDFQDLSAAEPRLVHKAQVKYAWDPAGDAVVAKAVKRSGAEVSEPKWKPQDRFACSDRRLFAFLDAGKDVVVTTAEGETIRGRMTWMGRWEFGLAVGKGAVEVTIFRHALGDLKEA